MDTKIKPSFWSDPVVDALPPEGKLALLWLFTSRVTPCGWVAATKRHFEFETGTPWQALLDAVKALGKGCVTHEKGLWIRNYVRYQIGEGERLARNNMRFMIQRSMRDVPASIRSEILSEYPALSEGLPKPSGSSAPLQERRGEERSTEEGMQGEKPKRATATTDEQWLSELAANAAYAGLSVPVEFAKAGVWCGTKQRKLTRAFFVGWLNRVEQPMTAGANGSNSTKPHHTLNPDFVPPDDRWKTHLAEHHPTPMRQDELREMITAGTLDWDQTYDYERKRVMEAMAADYPEAWK